ncbi:MAG: hypothetical protein LVQ97_03355 [Candidatus Micrarchaeales archaeon]|jgi:hypothetical protein|uniref:Uncharacterized protein n=1 Tax=Candidatus Micrarchaeum acidiphilum ARMAN-2 TaxID=425595 RepID=C7DGP8_MICA2|nr:MAG: hypothetical protein UNLARM2_1014 [Candidatus Micrarchaeum acidiphilum ARMAN-2]MCW6161197.1 hypothetical protein [Candidatus Micrarchaeales archaeon]
MPKESFACKDTGLPNAATKAKLLNAADSEIPFMISCVNRGIKSFVIVYGPSEQGIKKTAEPLNVAKKLVIPLRDDISNSPALIGKRVNEEIRINGFDRRKAMLVTRNIEDPQ